MDNRFEYGNNNSVSGQNFSNNTSVNAGGGNGESQNFGYSSPKNNSFMNPNGDNFSADSNLDSTANTNNQSFYNQNPYDYNKGPQSAFGKPEEERAASVDILGLNENPKNKKKDSKGKKQKEEKGTDSHFLRSLVSGAIFGIVAAAVFIGANHASGLIWNSKRDTKTTVTEQSKGNGTIEQGNPIDPSGTSTVNYDVAEIVKNSQTAIVSITVTMKSQYDFFYETYEQEAEGAGSGIIIKKDDKKLYIATNYHVIKGAETIKVGFSDCEIVDAKVLGGDEKQDIAVIEINLSEIPDSTMNTITIAAIGNSDELNVGEPAIAIGNALGYGQSVTVGYISALNRTISGNDNDMTYIQTDAAINPGNSGGALINAKGEVIGINSVKYVDSKVEGMGFSIPINTAMELINEIIDGTFGDVYLGIQTVNISKQYSEIYGMPEGVMIKAVEDDSPADKAQLHKGDIIVEFDGTEVYTNKELQKLLKEKEAGDSVEVTLYRVDSMGSYKKQTIKVTLQKDTSK